jgi:hypothetical protein
MIENDWGIRVEENGIDFIDIAAPGYQEALAAQKKTKLEAEAKRVKLEIEAQGRASETMGTIIQMLHQETGMTDKEIRQQIKDDPATFVKKYEPIIEKNWDLLNRKLAIEGGSFIDIRVEGAQGIERAFLNLITAWKRMPGGESEKSTQKKEDERNREDKIDSKRKRLQEYVAKRYPTGQTKEKNKEGS